MRDAVVFATLHRDGWGAGLIVGHWKTTTLVAALRFDGLTALMVLDGAMTGAAFLAYVRRLLASTLRPATL